MVDKSDFTSLCRRTITGRIVWPLQAKLRQAGNLQCIDAAMNDSPMLKCAQMCELVAAIPSVRLAEIAGPRPGCDAEHVFGSDDTSVKPTTIAARRGGEHVRVSGLRARDQFEEPL
jgi:hypothetical protein